MKIMIMIMIMTDAINKLIEWVRKIGREKEKFVSYATEQRIQKTSPQNIGE